MRTDHWWFTARLRLRSILRGRRLEQELDEELLFHLERKMEEGLAKGLTSNEARYAARRAMDGRNRNCGGQTQTASLTLTIAAIQDFSFAVNVSSMMIQQGGPGGTAIVSTGNFTQAGPGSLTRRSYK